MKNDSANPAPLYKRYRDLFDHGFTIDWFTTAFIVTTQLVALIATPFAYFYAPEGFWKIMLGWSVIHFILASLAITVYSHRMISHGAVNKVSWPVHVVFGLIGQTLSVQGSIRRWAALHVMHHGVDRSGKHHLDPYSATWFTSGWRNFLWSHMLTYLFFHPENDEEKRAYDAKSSPFLNWQDKHYGVLVTLMNFVLPLVLGAVLSGSLLGGVCLMIASICSFVLVQHNTWTVNSVTHMWGFVQGAFSSAKNNYVWLGPLGEGNHHADHHDFARDYRNGFGWSGWMLDPSRYVILLLSSLGLVSGLHRATKKQEAEIIARRKLLEARTSSHGSLWEAWETRLEHLKADWVESTRQWEAFKQKRVQLLSQSLPKLELQKRLDALKAEIELARRAMRARRQAFFDAIYEMRVAHYA